MTALKNNQSLYTLSNKSTILDQIEISEAEKAIDFNTPLPSHLDIGDLYRSPDGTKTSMTTEPQKTDQMEHVTEMAFLLGLSPVHNFSTEYIQTRFTLQVIHLREKSGKPLTELQECFKLAIEEAQVAKNTGQHEWTHRLNYVHLWKRTDECHYLLTDAEKLLYVRRFSELAEDLFLAMAHEVLVNDGMDIDDDQSYHEQEVKSAEYRTILGEWAKLPSDYTQEDDIGSFNNIADSILPDPAEAAANQEAKTRTKLQTKPTTVLQTLQSTPILSRQADTTVNMDFLNLMNN
ncbi:hypothetical protein EJ08DRAFT_657621 [Tothia fuscella]|uniref:Uncharacterized protein n=1 Tax=Tothia fuscella TaxID=1048955 RepID=A0A9P4NWZ9_9PEZI|nr:hypothetical protein EJ08DRAFT_657621 [Tothia fuscella]